MTKCENFHAKSDLNLSTAHHKITETDIILTSVLGYHNCFGKILMALRKAYEADNMIEKYFKGLVLVVLLFLGRDR